MRHYTHYYNENDPAAAHVLRHLIEAKILPHGHVDDRSIKDVQPDDLIGFTQVHLFAGGGLWAVAARLAGWPDDSPIWTFSCPCQPFSVAGKGAREDDPRHLWPDVFRLARAVRPAVLMGEQVAGQAGLSWFDGVGSDMEGVGYAARAVGIPAMSVNAPHKRERQYFVIRDLADTPSKRRDASAFQGIRGQTQGERPRHGEPERQHEFHGNLADANSGRRAGRTQAPERRSLGRTAVERINDGSHPSYAKWFSVCWHPSCRDSDRRGCVCDGLGAPEGWLWSDDDGWVESDLVNPKSIGRGEGRTEPELRSGRSAAASADASGDMANPAGDGWQQGVAAASITRHGHQLSAEDGLDDSGRQPWRAGPGEPQDRAFGSDLYGENFWHDAEWIICHDGKARRAKPGLRLLVNGLAGRIHAWRLAGNSIVPELAKEVMMAYIDAYGLPDRRG